MWKFERINDSFLQLTVHSHSVQHKALRRTKTKFLFVCEFDAWANILDGCCSGCVAICWWNKYFMSEITHFGDILCFVFVNSFVYLFVLSIKDSSHDRDKSYIWFCPLRKFMVALKICQICLKFHILQNRCINKYFSCSIFELISWFCKWPCS